MKRRVRRGWIVEMKKPKVLFLCIGNACRSIMAEAFARHFDGGCFEPFSAGMAPLGFIPPLTLEALKEADVSTVGLYSKGLSEVRLHEIDYIVDLTRRKAGRRIPPSSSQKLIPYPVRDPFGHDLETFRLVRQKIESFVGQELPLLVCRRKKFWWLHPGRLLASLKSRRTGQWASG